MPDLSSYSESDLMSKVAEGHEDSFRELFMRYHQQLGTHIYRLTKSADLAEEIVQDVFLKIWMSREALQGVQNFGGYLFVISKNHTLNCLRKLSRERVSMQKCEEHLARVAIMDEPASDIYHSLLDEAINQLPAQQQKVYLLSRHERLRYAEVANRLNISRETVKKYLQIATASITDYVQTNYNTIVLLWFLSIFF